MLYLSILHQKCEQNVNKIEKSEKTMGKRVIYLTEAKEFYTICARCTKIEVKFREKFKKILLSFFA